MENSTVEFVFFVYIVVTFSDLAFLTHMYWFLLILISFLLTSYYCYNIHFHNVQLIKGLSYVIVWFKCQKMVETANESLRWLIQMVCPKRKQILKFEKLQPQNIFSLVHLLVTSSSGCLFIFFFFLQLCLRTLSISLHSYFEGNAFAKKRDRTQSSRQIWLEACYYNRYC